jgi:4-deoxy-L-threo-5-hexosulose-uronate ketol-isomerase
MQIRTTADPVRYATLDALALRGSYLVEALFAPGELSLVYTDADRAIIGSAVPLAQPLALEAAAELRASYFTERRELGILNIGGSGHVVVDGERISMDHLDCLYVGMGSRSIVFESDDASAPASFYLLSYPAHLRYPTQKQSRRDAVAVQLGSQNECNRRTIYKYIHPDGIRSCQLVMGFTQLEPGSVWNTMPPHTHTRRSEVYLYFNLSPEARVIHLMGRPDETRHIVVADRQAVISPSWSIHSGVGVSNYAFCWGMGGENQAFDDMDGVAVGNLL